MGPSCSHGQSHRPEIPRPPIPPGSIVVVCLALIVFLTGSDTLASDHLAVRGGQPVHSTDGEIGRIRAARVDANSRQATHILLQEGHLWGKREVAIPWDSVTSLDGGLHLSLTSEAIKELPAVPS